MTHRQLTSAVERFTAIEGFPPDTLVAGRDEVIQVIKECSYVTYPDPRDPLTPSKIMGMSIEAGPAGTWSLKGSRPPLRHTIIDEEGWFADVSDEHANLWMPILQTGSCCLPLPIWFKTESACVAYIKSNIVGKGLLK